MRTLRTIFSMWAHDVVMITWMMALHVVTDLCVQAGLPTERRMAISQVYRMICIGSSRVPG